MKSDWNETIQKLFDAFNAIGLQKGVNARWRDTLTAEESAEYEARAEAELGHACAHWLATGERID